MKKLKSIAIIIISLSFFYTAEAQWIKVVNGLTDTFVRCLVVNGTNLFAATGSNGVFLSTNNGDNWVPVNTGLTSKYVMCFVVSGNNLFAGTYESGIFLTTNNGKSWTNVSAGLPKHSSDTTEYLEIQNLVVINSKMFAGTNGGGIYLSTDNGTSWTDVNNGISQYASIYGFAAIRDNIFAALYDSIYQSTNYGANWAM